MRFLVTNDDGYLAPGLGLLTRVASRLGEVDVVAPDREQSATSHSLTMHRPLRVRRVGDAARVVDGTPTDCVFLALGELLDEPPDFVLSGINHGSNLGDDVLYSGTVAAAMEATLLGLPAIALSYAARDPEPPLDEAWEELLAGLLRQVVERESFPKETLLNVNLPPVPAAQVKGTQVTVLGRRAYDDSLTRATDPSGREYFWIGGGESRWWGSDRSDFAAVREGYISITPLHLDLTNHRLLEHLEGWKVSLP
ncbi:MAG TPA: 5'/3'-nucleotidase SurE [Longimicrobiales bacterium]|nr:5'/3'-nucleotidase SurE [Longimicrobiales bacterium]